jgi:hypothetical protein
MMGSDRKSPAYERLDRTEEGKIKREEVKYG